jgi:hypothetical protein
MNQSSGTRHALPWDMTDVLYRCATTGQNVQVWYADDVPDDCVYISLRCPACARMHLVNRERQNPHAADAPVRVGKIHATVRRGVNRAHARRCPSPRPARWVRRSFEVTVLPCSTAIFDAAM